MRLRLLTLGLLCTSTVACGAPSDTGSTETTSSSSTGGTDSTHGSTDHTTSGTTADLTGGGMTGTDSATTDPDPTTGTTGHDHTTDSSTGHDHSTTGTTTTGVDTDVPGTTTTGTTEADTTGTTGVMGGCADLGEKECMMSNACMPIAGGKIDAMQMCVAKPTFLACVDAGACGDAITIACMDGSKDPWMFPSTCIPDDFSPCDGQIFDQPCK